MVALVLQYFRQGQILSFHTLAKLDGDATEPVGWQEAQQLANNQIQLS